MEERVKKTLEYIEKRLSELNNIIYGDGTEEGDFAALINTPYNPEFVDYESERKALSYIQNMLKGS